MPSISPSPLPEHALLNRYARAGAYTDCFVTETAGAVGLAPYLEAFYTAPLFKLERRILQSMASLPSTDAQARRLAAGSIDAFAAWRVEARAENQLLMCDLHGSTRSWFMVAPAHADNEPRTRLYFGSAVTKSAMAKPLFRWLLGFHVLYSKALLAAARRRINV